MKKRHLDILLFLCNSGKTNCLQGEVEFLGHLFITLLIIFQNDFWEVGLLPYCQDSSVKIILKFPLLVGIQYEKLQA